MPSRRDAIHAYYSQAPGLRKSILERAAAAASTFVFRGPAIKAGIVVRSDLNGYSAWARSQNVAARAAILDEYFSKVVPLIIAGGGVFFRDEGDCIVALFTPYFPSYLGADAAESYAMRVSASQYGGPQLTVTSVVTASEIAFFQKAHEVGTQDWSAEGEAFVRAARLEASLAGIQEVAFFADDYDAVFASSSNKAAPGSAAKWTVRRTKHQVPGLGLSGGWTDCVFFDRG